jgi:hypothetical protein
MTATNRYYEDTLQATIGGLVRSAAIKAQLDAIQHAFDLLQAKGIPAAQILTEVYY